MAEPSYVCRYVPKHQKARITGGNKTRGSKRSSPAMSAGMSLDIWQQATSIAVCRVGMFLKYLSLPGVQSRVKKPKNNKWQIKPCLQVYS
jgi:hypothetical protein